jgi:hypothetical protein
MIDVCVTQQNGINVVRGERKGASIPFGGIVSALDQTTIEQHATARHV